MTALLGIKVKRTLSRQADIGRISREFAGSAASKSHQPGGEQHANLLQGLRQ
jgi:hypothetical protein